MSKRIYLVGPEVFLLNARDRQAGKALCRKYGFEGVFPLAVEIDAGGRQNFGITTVDDLVLYHRGVSYTFPGYPWLHKANE